LQTHFLINFALLRIGSANQWSPSPFLTYVILVASMKSPFRCMQGRSTGCWVGRSKHMLLSSK
jgi:hypothetical protein